jgi:hypothetical protein
MKTLSSCGSYRCMHLAYAAEFFCGKICFEKAPSPFFIALIKMKIFSRAFLLTLFLLVEN